MNDITIDINKDETEAQRIGRMIKYLRLSTGMKRGFCQLFSYSAWYCA